MEATPQVSFPAPEANDSSDVQSALAAAGNLWQQDPRESLAWLKKAAESAADAGDIIRSVQLARAAADLRSLANITGSLPPPSGSVPAPSGEPPAESPALVDVPAGLAGASPTSTQPGVVAPQIAAETPPALDAAAFAAAMSQNPAQTVPATPAAAAAAALQAASAAVLAAGLGGSGANGQPPLQPRVQPAAARAVGVAGPPAFPAGAPPLPIAGQPIPGQASAGQPEVQEPAPVSSPPSAPRFATHRAVRVALSPMPIGAGQFSIHPLGEGETAEPGWKEALLVSLDPSERLFPGRD